MWMEASDRSIAVSQKLPWQTLARYTMALPFLLGKRPFSFNHSLPAEKVASLANHSEQGKSTMLEFIPTMWRFLTTFFESEDACMDTPLTWKPTVNITGPTKIYDTFAKIYDTFALGATSVFPHCGKDGNLIRLTGMTFEPT